jgi:hypothetical protein
VEQLSESSTPAEDAATAADESVGSESLEELFGADTQGPEWADASEPPQPWAYVHYAANLYALYVDNWIKHQTAQV